MLILLPPSENKTPPAPEESLGSLDMAQLRFPSLTAAREQVITALIEASGRDDAQQVLGVGARVMDEVRANRELRSAPTTPAHRLYTGVLFDAMQPEHFDTPAQHRAAESVLIYSGLFGVTGFADPLPQHRLSMGVRLTPFGDDRDPGGLGRFWREAIGDVLDDHIGDRLVLDCRSASYAAAHRPPADQTLTVNSVTEVDGVRKVVTHVAKHARGELAGLLLRAEKPARTIEEVAEVAGGRWDVELRPAQGRTPHQLDLISRH